MTCLQRYNQYLESLLTEFTGLDLAGSTLEPESTSHDHVDVTMGGNSHDGSNMDMLSNSSSDDDSSALLQEEEWGGMRGGMREPDDYVNGVECSETLEHAGEVIGQDLSAFERVRLTYNEKYFGNYYYPFASEEEWSLAIWLDESSLSLADIDKFLKLPYVNARPLSFQTGAALRDRLSQLPNPGPGWMAKELIPNNGTPSDPVILFYRDPVDIVKMFLSSPSFSEHLDFAPSCMWEDENMESRLYNEISTGDWWWRTQESLPEGSTVIPVLLGSDVTHLTNFAGDKKGWPIYMSIGNIRSKIRNAPSKGAWTLLGYIPIANWLDDDSIRGTLTMRLYHQSLEFVLKTLVQPGIEGIGIADSIGNIRHCYLRVAAHLADFPEQALVNCAPCNHSPVTTAFYHHLDDPEPHAPRTRNWILDRISAVAEEVDPDDIKSYQGAAAQRGLNGVHRPYWRELPGYQPEICIPPDILHGVIRFWHDHILKWTTTLVRPVELDKRIMALQWVVGHRHFKDGIRHLSQWTMREDRELQCTSVVVVAGTPKINQRIMTNLRSFHDFLYLVQYRSQSDETLGYITRALHIFHQTKDAWILAGARRGRRGVIKHFRLPKLVLFHHYAKHIREMGSSPQFSTEIIEANHRPLVKEPYNATNHKDFMPQMCRTLDRHERVRRHKEFLAWIEESRDLEALEERFQAYSPGYRAHAIAKVRKERAEKMIGEYSVRYRAKCSHVHVTANPAKRFHSLEALSDAYQLPDLLRTFQRFLRETAAPRGSRYDDILSIDVWTRFRITLDSVQDPDLTAPPRTIEAFPPSDAMPYGHCHCVLVRASEDAWTTGISGYRVAQVRLIFKPSYTAHTPAHTPPLLYVEYFTAPRKIAEKALCMYQVSRRGHPGARPAEIISITDVHRFVQLVPKFGPVASANIKADTSMERYTDFYINSFADKEIYQSVY